MNKQEYINVAEGELLHTYNRFPMVLDHGKDVYLYDVEGKEYLDFTAGIAVCSLGYSNENYKNALKSQVDKLLHTSNLYYNTPIIEAAQKILKAAQMDRVFFTNSGAEAIEGAIKSAKKYAYTKNNKAGYEVIAMENSFHGRTIGALSVTGNEHYREAFEPLMPGVKFAKYNNLESVIEQIIHVQLSWKQFRVKEEFILQIRNFLKVFEKSVMKKIFYLFLMKFNVEWDVQVKCLHGSITV